MQDTIVVGGGAIGLSIARDLALRGRSVLLLERGLPGEGTSWAAAGMLSPQSESTRPGPFFDLGMASLRMYAGLASELKDATGMDCGYTAAGSLRLALSAEEVASFDEIRRWQSAAGFRAEWLSARDVSTLEPRLVMPVAGALFFPDEGHVTPRLLTKALEAVCVQRGVRIRSGHPVQEIAVVRGRVSGVRAGGVFFSAAEVVVASGVWSGALAGLKPAIPVAPRKGQILSLDTHGAVFQRPIRWEGAYAVPRPSGELIIGATNEDTGFDRSLTPAGLGGLLHEAQRLAPEVGSYPVREMWTGLRPATPDELPIIGPSAVEGLFYATGHYRNGILLAPVTAASVTALIENGPPPVPLDPFSPMRFQA